MALKTCTVGIHKKCVELRSGDFRLAITTQVGPRVIGAFIGKKSAFNHFAVLPPEPMEVSANGFTLYGGHRLWHSPEQCPRTYEPDNDPVQVTPTEYGVLFSTEPCKATGIQKEMLIEPLGDAGLFCVTHAITNTGMWPIQLAPWTLAQMAAGGTCVVPMGSPADESEADPYAPDRTLNFWPYTNLQDKRLKIGKDLITVAHDAKAEGALKLGVNNTCRWVAYVNNGQAIIKYFDVYDAEYPDNGCISECYTCKTFTEMELLGPLETLEPGESTEFVEYWQAVDGLPKGLKSEKDFKNALLPHLIPEMLEEQDECGCGCGCEDDEPAEDDECGCGCHGHHGHGEKSEEAVIVEAKPAAKKAGRSRKK